MVSEEFLEAGDFEFRRAGAVFGPELYVLLEMAARSQFVS
jgi:hypothetical protein